MLIESRLQEIYKNLGMYPVPEYDDIIVSSEGLIRQINLETGEIIEPIPVGHTKHSVQKYELTKYTGEKSIVNLDRLILNTFIGIMNECKIERCIDRDCDLDNLSYRIDSVEEIDSDTLLINNVEFRRIYVNKRTIPTDYFISDNGVVYSTKTNKFKVHAFQHNYYIRIEISVFINGHRYQKKYSVHRLVYETWYNETLDDTIPINHKNGRKNDNHYLNLEKSTPLENLHHAMENNLRYARWTPETVSEVCELLETNKYKPDQIANRLGYRRDADKKSVKNLIKKIIKGEVWQDVAKRYDLSAYKSVYHGKTVPDEVVHKICQMYVDGYSRKEISEAIGYSLPWVNEVIRGEKRADISSQYPIDRSKIRRITSKETFIRIGNDIMNGISTLDVSKKYNIDRESVYKFLRRKMYPELGLQFHFEKVLPNLKYEIPYQENGMSKEINVR